jgi:hypothetical protein
MSADDDTIVAIATPPGAVGWASSVERPQSRAIARR